MWCVLYAEAIGRHEYMYIVLSQYDMLECEFCCKLLLLLNMISERRGEGGQGENSWCVKYESIV